MRIEGYRCGRPYAQGDPFDLDSKHRVLRGFLQGTGDSLEQY